METYGPDGHQHPPIASKIKILVQYSLPRTNAINDFVVDPSENWNNIHARDSCKSASLFGRRERRRRNRTIITRQKQGDSYFFVLTLKLVLCSEFCAAQNNFKFWHGTWVWASARERCDGGAQEFLGVKPSTRCKVAWNLCFISLKL